MGMRQLEVRWVYTLLQLKVEAANVCEGDTITEGDI